MIYIFRTCLRGRDLYDLHDLHMFADGDLYDLLDLITFHLWDLYDLDLTHVWHDGICMI